MTIYHRKLLPGLNYNQTDCSDCTPTCSYDCYYEFIYWSPEPPQLQPSSTDDDNSTINISPYLIVTVAIIGAAILFISYYLIMTKYWAWFWQRSATQNNDDSEEFMNEPHPPEIDHPIWYITTIGLQPAIINSIAVVKFRKEDKLIDVMDCSVCLSEFEDDEYLRLLPKCNHAFHIPCIDTWLRSHTNCPLCRGAVLSNNAKLLSQANNQFRNHGFSLNQNSQMENAEHGAESGTNGAHETEIRETVRETRNGGDVEDSKTETGSLIALRRSVSVNLSAEPNSSDSTIELQNLNNATDSRARRMMMMVRSFSYSGGSIM